MTMKTELQAWQLLVLTLQARTSPSAAAVTFGFEQFDQHSYNRKNILVHIVQPPFECCAVVGIGRKAETLLLDDCKVLVSNKCITRKGIIL